REASPTEPYRIAPIPGSVKNEGILEGAMPCASASVDRPKKRRVRLGSNSCRLGAGSTSVISQTAFFLYAEVSVDSTPEFPPFPFGAYRTHFLKRKVEEATMAHRNEMPTKRTIRRHQLREMVPLADSTIYEME
ncbi:MAG TPA: hypothetical protein VIP11_14535, partial [Gemmatimonadaceae bacterium]